MNAAPALALSWQLWGRQRWTAAAIGVYLAGLAIAARQPGAVEWSSSIFSAAVPLAFLLLFFVARFAYPEGDVLGRVPSFPPEQFLLPVRTSQLVFWPMLYGGLAAGSAWLAFASLVLRPLNVEAPLVWPALLAAAAVTWLQALLWIPIGLPYLRVVLALTLIPGLVTGAVLAVGAEVAPSLVTCGLLAAIVAGYGAATAGLARTRTGDTPDWTWQLRGRRRAESAGYEQRVDSAAQAQLVCEWRSAGLLLPLVTLVVFTLLSLPLLWLREAAPIVAQPPPATLFAIEVNLWLKLQVGCLFFPPLLAAIVGFGRRTYDRGTRDFQLHPFLAVRPLPETAFAAARLHAAAWSTALTWAVVAGFVTGWLLLPARLDGQGAPLLVLLARFSSPATGVALALILGFLAVWTWKNLVQGMWADLSGSALVVYGVPFLAHTLPIAAGLFVLTRLEPSDAPPGSLTVPPIIIGMLLAGLGVKLAAAAGTVWVVVRQRLATPGRLAGWAAAWLAGAVAVFGILHWLAVFGTAPLRPSGVIESWLIMIYVPICSDAQAAGYHSPMFLAGVSLLFVPFSRLLLVPLMLHRNRHH